MKSLPINTREITTTERTNVGNPEALLRYLRSALTGRAVTPVAVAPTLWVTGTLERATAERPASPGLAVVLASLRRAQYCLLDGDHRALAAALLDRPVEAMVIVTPADLDAYRRFAPSFPHADLDMRTIAERWLEFAFGPLAHATFAIDAMTVAQRARAIVDGGLLPLEAQRVLSEADADPQPKPVPSRAAPCTCPGRPGTVDGAASWRDFAARKAGCPLHGRRR